MRNRLSLNRTNRGGGKLLPVFATLLASIVLCGSYVRAQESDLSSSAGVFIEPGRARAAAPRERSAPQRPAPRRTKPKPVPAKPTGRTTPAVTAESLNARAETAIDAGRFAEAVEPLRQALKLKPDFADAHYNLGFALHSLGQSAEAVEPLRRATQLDPADADAPVYLGAALAKLGRHAEAAAAYEQAARLSPRSASVL